VAALETKAKVVKEDNKAGSAIVSSTLPCYKEQGMLKLFYHPTIADPGQSKDAGQIVRKVRVLKKLCNFLKHSESKTMLLIDVCE
jgi:hypothetical protein